MILDPRLTQLLCARLCHDLGGAVGTIAGMLDLLENSNDEALDVARDAAVDLRRRLKLYSAAWGQSAQDMRAPEIAELLAGAPVAARVRFRIEAFLPVRLPAFAVPMVLNAALLAAEALPRGGAVHVSGGAESGLAVWPEGIAAAWPGELIAALSGADMEQMIADGPRRALVPWLLALVVQAGWDASLGLGAGQGVAPLLMMPGRG